MLAGVPLLVVCVFWYSPRYRMPSLPVLALGAAYSWTQARRHPGFAVAGLSGLAGSLIVTATGFERTSEYEPSFYMQLGGLEARLDDLEARP